MGENGGRKTQDKSKWWKGMDVSDVSREVYAAARMRYPAPEWVILEEIEIPGSRLIRRADLVAISVRGAPRVIVLEVKASRDDFLKEIRDPLKREPGMKIGTEFLYVIPRGMVDKSEIPDGCGFLEVQKGGSARLTLAGRQRSDPGWSQAVVHSIIGKLMRREDPDFRTLLEAGNNAAKTCRRIFKLAGKDMDFSDLMDVVRAMNRGHRFKAEEVRLATESYRNRKDKDPEVIALCELRDAVREKCGYRALSASGFREWFGESSGEVSNPDFARKATFLLNQIKKTADRILKDIDGGE